MHLARRDQLNRFHRGLCTHGIAPRPEPELIWSVSRVVVWIERSDNASQYSQFSFAPLDFDRQALLPTDRQGRLSGLRGLQQATWTANNGRPHRAVFHPLIFEIHGGQFEITLPQRLSDRTADPHGIPAEIVGQPLAQHGNLPRGEVDLRRLTDHGNRLHTPNSVVRRLRHRPRQVRWVLPRLR